MDNSTQELPRHPLGAGLGLKSRVKLAVSVVNDDDDRGSGTRNQDETLFIENGTCRTYYTRFEAQS